MRLGGDLDFMILLVLLHYSELCFLPYIQVNFRTELDAMTCEWLNISWHLVMDLLAMDEDDKPLHLS